jgi:serine/threonine protein kinase
MGPELILGNPSGEKVDIFALGCILFQMINEGVHPFAGFDASDLPQVYGQEDPFEMIESTGFDGDAVLVGLMRQMLNVNVSVLLAAISQLQDTHHYPTAG